MKCIYHRAEHTESGAKKDTPLAVCYFYFLLTLVYVSWLRSLFLSATRLTSDGYRQRYLDTQNAMKCPKTAAHKELNLGSITQENASATNQLNLYPKDTKASLHQLHPWHHHRHCIPNRLWWVIFGRWSLVLVGRAGGKLGKTERIEKERSGISIQSNRTELHALEVCLLLSAAGCSKLLVGTGFWVLSAENTGSRLCSLRRTICSWDQYFPEAPISDSVAVLRPTFDER